jgi:hypothetical protein
MLHAVGQIGRGAGSSGRGHRMGRARAGSVRGLGSPVRHDVSFARPWRPAAQDERPT